MADSDTLESPVGPAKRIAVAGNLGAGPFIWRRDAGDLFHLAAEDPLLVFGSEIMTIILGKLDIRSVAEARLVSRGWQAVASCDRIWAPKVPLGLASLMHVLHFYGSANCTEKVPNILRRNLKHVGNGCRIQCEELWLGKAHIPRISMAEGLPKMVACLLSIKDGKRTRITRDDLCDHVWEFRFTESAPEYWRDLDPYWRGDGGTPMRRYFHPDGSITADANDKVWGGHESSYTIVTGLLADGKVREHYVRINRWPKMVVERQPDWSWMLKNHLYCYNSIRDADRPGGTGPSVPVAAADPC